MEEYVLADGTIRLGPDCIGAVEFEDGHYEPIINAEFITKTHFRFVTSSGLYSYRQDVVWEEKLYCDPDTYVYGHHRYRFGKYDYDKSEWNEIYTIARVYVYEPAFPIFKEEN